MANSKKKSPKKNIVKNKKVKTVDEIKKITNKRGRPRKVIEETPIEPPKKRGRPKKIVEEEKVVEFPEL